MVAPAAAGGGVFAQWDAILTAPRLNSPATPKR